MHLIVTRIYEEVGILADKETLMRSVIGFPAFLFWWV